MRKAEAEAQGLREQITAKDAAIHGFKAKIAHLSEESGQRWDTIDALRGQKADLERRVDELTLAGGQSAGEAHLAREEARTDKIGADQHIKALKEDAANSERVIGELEADNARLERLAMEAEAKVDAKRDALIRELAATQNLLVSAYFTERERTFVQERTVGMKEE